VDGRDPDDRAAWPERTETERHIGRWQRVVVQGLLGQFGEAQCLPKPRAHGTRDEPDLDTLVEVIAIDLVRSDDRLVPGGGDLVRQFQADTLDPARAVDRGE